VPRIARAVVEGSEEIARRDRAMRRIVEQIGPADLRRGRPRRTHFAELARAICYQQLAGAAASAIHGRFDALFDGQGPTPEGVLALPVETLRGVGLSGSKTASIRDLAEKVVAGDVELDRVGRLADDEIVRELTLVRGIGRWTAEMFLIFQLGRLDVWPVDDFGVRRGYGIVQGWSEMPTPKQLEPLGDAYRPYRSIAAWYCWRAADTKN
jgi:DNA-3-methyladenine glycosylase II